MGLAAFKVSNRDVAGQNYQSCPAPETPQVIREHNQGNVAEYEGCHESHEFPLAVYAPLARTRWEMSKKDQFARVAS